MPRKSPPIGRPRKTTRREAAGVAVRGRLLTEALRALVVLRRGRWTVPELAAELGIEWRTAYRLLASLRAAGVTVDVSRERAAGQRGIGDGYYTIPAEPLRRLLKLR